MDNKILALLKIPKTVKKRGKREDRRGKIKEKIQRKESRGRMEGEWKRK